MHIQACFLKINILNDDDVNFIDIFNENFNDIDVFNEIFIDEKSLNNQFAIAYVLNKKYQRTLKVFRIEKRIVKFFFDRMHNNQ